MLYDSNAITIEGNDLAFNEDVASVEAYNWQVLKVKDGNDVDAIANAIEAAKSEKDKPFLIIITTQIGYGSPQSRVRPLPTVSPWSAEN